MYYKAFNLIIQSDIKLPELLPFFPTDQNPDVIIRIGKTPKQLENPTVAGVRFQLREKEMLLQVDDIAHFWVQNGQGIVVEPLSDDKDAIRLFLLGSALGVLLQQKEYLVLHGSAVTKDDFSIAFCGISGAGKSTLSQAFNKRGYQLLADDLCVVQKSKDANVVVPSFPHNKLWADSLDFLKINSENLRKVRKELPKYSVPVNNFCENAQALKAIFILNQTNFPDISIASIKGVKKINALRANSYRSFLIPSQGLTALHFKTINAIGQRIPVYEVQRPKSFQQTDKLMDQIEVLLHER